MGMQETAHAPNIYGLPEYNVTEGYAEIEGRDVRMAFGTKKFGQVEWLYTAVMEPEKLLSILQYLESVAIEARNLAMMIGGERVGHH